MCIFPNPEIRSQSVNKQKYWTRFVVVNSDLKRKGEVRFTLIFPFFLSPPCNVLGNNRLKPVLIGIVSINFIIKITQVNLFFIDYYPCLPLSVSFMKINTFVSWRISTIFNPKRIFSLCYQLQIFYPIVCFNIIGIEFAYKSNSALNSSFLRLSFKIASLIFW